MNLQDFRKVVAVAALAAGTAAFTLPAAAQGSGMMQGYSRASDDNGGSRNYGPGMMRGYGMGPGMMGGYGGYGMGPGMMGGYGGYGMGPGMMGGYGGYGMGPGMMGGYGGYGMAPGMMGGYGGYGMGPGMMGGYGGYGPAVAGVLDLTDQQQRKIEDIQENLGKQQWGLMQSMHSQMLALPQAYDQENLDVDAIMKTQKALSDTRLQMLRNNLEAQKQIEGVLTAEQKKRISEMQRWNRGR